MPFGSTLPHAFLTSHFRPGVDQRTTPVDTRGKTHRCAVADGDSIAVVAGESPRLWMHESNDPGLVYLGHGEYQGQGEYLGHGDTTEETCDASDRAVCVWAQPPGEVPLPEGVSMHTLRPVGPRLSRRERNLALTAVGMLTWHRDYRYCASCGTPIEPRRDGWVLQCGNDHMHFPRTDPAVIVAITDSEDRLLLAKNRRTHTAMVSVLAGFVEPGEDFESAIVREVHEEVGLTVDRLEYRASQPWPYPRSLMIGYRARVTAETDPDALVLQDEEIEHARWWTRREFHEARANGSLVIPDSASIARALINEWSGAPEC